MKIECSLLVHAVTAHSCDSADAFKCFQIRQLKKKLEKNATEILYYRLDKKEGGQEGEN